MVVLPSWPRERNSISNATGHAGTGFVEEPGKRVYLISNVTMEEIPLFRNVEDYTLFGELARRHLDQVAEPLAFLLTPVSFEILIRSHLRITAGKSAVYADAVVTKSLAAMLTHYVRSAHRRHQSSGSMFARSFRKLVLPSETEQHATIGGMAHAAKVLDNVFGMPVKFDRNW
jgi:hypothetical protein